MKRKIITVIAIILTIGIIGISLTPQDVLAAIGSDISGKPSQSAGGGTVSGKSGYSMKLSTMIKVSLVDISNPSYPVVHPNGERYYIWTKGGSDIYYKILTGKYGIPNKEGAYYVCGYIEGGTYTSNCRSIQNKMEEIPNWGSQWFMADYAWGANISAGKINETLSDAEFFAGVVNKLNIQSLLENGKDFKLEDLTANDIATLKNYRLIVEPVYTMSWNNENKEITGYSLATVKGWGRKMIDEQQAEYGLGIDHNTFAINVFASNAHGSINKNGLRDLPSNNRDYYNVLGDVNSGYGYGIFYIIGGCDPNTQCCYDENGKYHEEYFETTSNFRCENGEQGKDCTTQVQACSIKSGKCPSDSGSGPNKLKCVSDADFKEVKNRENIITTRTITKSDGAEHTHYWKEDTYDKTLGDQFCTDDLKQTITGDVTITQKGNFVNSLFPSSIYSGGGFSFEASYAGNASYQLCDELNYKIEQWKNDPKCPNVPTYGREYVSSKRIINGGWQCTYTIREKYTGTCCSGTGENRTCRSCTKSRFKRTTTADTIKKCAEQDDIEVTCKNGAWDLGCIEDKDGDKVYSEAFQTFAKKMADDFLEEPELIASTLSQDSNKVDNSNSVSSSMGEWKVTKSDIPTYWYPEEDNAAIYELEFVPLLSCINVRTAQVDYFPYVSGDSCEKHETKAVEYIGNNTITYIDGDRLYYVPLKEPDGSYFPVKVNIDEVSVLKIMNWKIDYECGVDCDQNLYSKKGNFKFIYRPIDMSNPFPKIVNENRLIGDNWKTFMSDKKAIESKMNRNGDNKEYTVTLTPTLISNIKTYNNNKNYTSLNTIYDSGRSDFLKDYAIENMKKDNYNKLGYCTDECWPTMEVYGGEF